MQTYELCSDMIDVVIDVSCIYGYSDTITRQFLLYYTDVGHMSLVHCLLYCIGVDHLFSRTLSVLS